MKDASLKVPPSVRGVVIDKKLFARIVRDRKQRAKEKELLAKPEEEYNNIVENRFAGMEPSEFKPEWNAVKAAAQ